MSPAPPTHRPEPPAPAPDDEAEEGSGRRSYKARKAESHALGRLAKALVDMKPSALAELPLPDDVRERVQVARGLERVARVRELRRVVALLRGHGIVSLEGLARDTGRARRQRAAREREYEAWRERLVSEGDRALAELVSRYPTADAQRLRQLVRQARQGPDGDRAKQALRTVLRLVRQACEADAAGSPQANAEPDVPTEASENAPARPADQASARPDAEAASIEADPEG